MRMRHLRFVGASNWSALVIRKRGAAPLQFCSSGTSKSADLKPISVLQRSCHLAQTSLPASVVLLGASAVWTTSNFFHVGTHNESSKLPRPFKGSSWRIPDISVECQVVRPKARFTMYQCESAGHATSTNFVSCFIVFV